MTRASTDGIRRPTIPNGGTPSVQLTDNTLKGAVGCGRHGRSPSTRGATADGPEGADIGLNVLSELLALLRICTTLASCSRKEEEQARPRIARAAAGGRRISLLVSRETQDLHGRSTVVDGKRGL